MATGPARTRKLYGKYRGIVVENADPMQRGRVRVSVPGVVGARTMPWAEVCLPTVDGPAAMPPAIGTPIWVEFEAGDVRRPIWTGKLWPQPGDALSLAAPITIGLADQAMLTLGDAAGRGITLRTASGAMIVVGDGGIAISNGQGASIMLTGPNVSVNHGALVVI